MKLLIFSPYYPPHTGGLENFTDELNKYLDKQDVLITVFTPHLPCVGPEKEVRFRNVRIIRFPAFEIVSNYPLPKFWTSRFWTLFFSLFKEDFDITIAETRFFATSVIAFIYAKIKGTKLVNIEHGSAFVELSSKFKNKVAKLYDLSFGRLVLRMSDGNIAISQAVSKFVGKFDKRIAPVIYRGLDLTKIGDIAPDLELKNNSHGKIIIAFVGRLYKWKGVENSIKAVLNLPSEIKQKVIFIIAGDGEDYDHLRKLADESVIFWGNVPNDKAIGLLKVSDIFIHSALPGGGLSTSLLEAMYCRCAVIATPNEGAREVIVDQENGLLINESNSNLIKEKIIELYNNKNEREEYARNAKAAVEKSFDWDVNAGKYIEYFEEILKSNK